MFTKSNALLPEIDIRIVNSALAEKIWLRRLLRCARNDHPSPRATEGGLPQSTAGKLILRLVDKKVLRTFVLRRRIAPPLDTGQHIKCGLVVGVFL